MKKLIALLLALVMVMALAACGATETKEPETQPTEPSAEATEPTEDTTTEEPTSDEVAVMTYEEFMAAELEAKVCVETYVQATQSWWEDKITLRCQRRRRLLHLRAGLLRGRFRQDGSRR